MTEESENKNQKAPSEVLDGIKQGLLVVKRNPGKVLATSLALTAVLAPVELNRRHELYKEALATLPTETKKVFQDYMQATQALTNNVALLPEEEQKAIFQQIFNADPQKLHEQLDTIKSEVLHLQSQSADTASYTNRPVKFTDRVGSDLAKVRQ